VDSAAIAAFVPLDIHGLPLRPFTLEGRTRSDAAPDQALLNIVTPGYFNTMGIPFRDGRDFTELNDATAAPQAIVNEEFVRRYVGHAESIGRSLESGRRKYVITGVVRNSLYDSFGEPPIPIIYFSYRDRPGAGGQIHLRTHPGTEMAHAPALRTAVRDIDPSLPVYDVRTLSDHVEKNLFLRRIPAQMFAVLGPLLLVLAAIGIYGVVAYAVSHRTAEIGVRMALGATARRIQVQIVRESMRAIGHGALAGWLIAFVIYIHVARGVLDLRVLLGVPALLLLVALTACWLPARRATRIDPMVALRYE